VDWVTPMLERFGYMDEFQQAQDWFAEWGFWAILVAGFSPIPYKIFTIAAGAMSMLLVPFVAASVVGRGARFPFVAASVVGRGARFFLVSALIFWGGESFERNLRRFIDLIGWAVVGLGLVAFLILR